ncbi:MAG: KH domain-containing protein [Firmicutes bacterium]|nr:KH domain-containing protein [Bacillota bacterium]
MTNLVEIIAKALVDNPDKVVVTKASGSNGTEGDVIQLQVASADMGKVIGKQGRIAKALRTVVKAAGVKDNQNVTVEIVSDEEVAEIAE